MKGQGEGPLEGKTVVLGVTGSIAVYKSLDVASKLTQQKAFVDVIMSQAAAEFVKPISFRAVTGRQVLTDMFDLNSQFSVEHVALAQAANVVVVAPATANTIAKIAAGMADNMLCCTVLATKAPVIIAPAMNVDMWDNSITQENIAKLKHRGFTIIGPGHGWLAEGRIGCGRMVDTPEIIDTIKLVLGRGGDLAGRHVVVTAGGTQEPLDPVRHISNRSSGKMGYALAEAARDRGARVTLIAAPVSLPNPVGVAVRRVSTAQDMYEAVSQAVSDADVLLMSAAVADYRPAEASSEKIKKGEAELVLKLTRTRDILDEVRGNFVRVGFAAESQDLVASAEKKLKKKDLDLIVANDISREDTGFGADMNRVVIMERGGKREDVPLMPKRQVADRILDRVTALLAKRVTG
ncbi:MAG: bifunctional phosphopantothenoylcysteine decarboxylase/phosphopantothenate--cysteine ligase CoaBC [Chloroflexi bacterium]|nr:bifunctional phosphopantothenoylcysteine decarboxylase/phosphopantothenate--cysteine ligase CoaBC [Chloroflexota bacterium]